MEVGTFTGYSAICWAEGLAEDGVIHTLEYNTELEKGIREYFEKSGYADRIHLHIGDAKEIIPTLDNGFDLAYIDADKVNYPNYFDMILPKLNIGGYLIADNVLWSGNVLDPKDDESNALRAYSEKVMKDDRVENVLLAIRDGLMIARKLRD